MTFDSIGNNEIEGLFNIRAGETSSEKGLQDQNVLVATPILTLDYVLSFKLDYNFASSSGTPFFVSATNVSNPVNFEPIYYIFELIIHNRTGAEDDYDLSLYNLTTDDTIYEETGFTLANKTQASKHLIIPAERYKAGDAIYFIITDGNIGTHVDEPIHGQFGMRIIAMSYPETIGAWIEKQELS